MALAAEVVAAPDPGRREIEAKFALPVSVARELIQNPATSRLVRFLDSQQLLSAGAVARVVVQKTAYNDDEHHTLALRRGVTARERLNSDRDPCFVVGLKGIDVEAEAKKHRILLGMTAATNENPPPLDRLENEGFGQIVWKQLSKRTQREIADSMITQALKLQKQFNIRHFHSKKRKAWKRRMRELLPYLAQEVSRAGRNPLHVHVAELPKPPIFEKHPQLELEFLREFGGIAMMHLEFPEAYGIKPQKRSYDRVARCFIDFVHQGVHMELAIDLGLSYGLDNKPRFIISEWELECKKDRPTPQDLAAQNWVEEQLKSFFIRTHKQDGLKQSASKGYYALMTQIAEHHEKRGLPLRRHASQLSADRANQNCLMGVQLFVDRTQARMGTSILKP